MLERSKEAVAFYSSKEWRRCRKAYAASVDGLCERCLKKGFYVPGKIVHHKIHLNAVNIQNPQISLNFANLEYLCQECHNEEHFNKGLPKRYKFDEFGNMIITGENTNGNN